MFGKIEDYFSIRKKLGIFELCKSEISETFIYYICYSSYRMTTTIQLNEKTKELISTFGTKKDTYDDILNRIYKLAVKEQLREFLMSSKDTVTTKEARKMINN